MTLPNTTTRPDSPASERSNSPGANDRSWVEETTQAGRNDDRVQPWKHIYGSVVDNTLEPGPDYMTVTSQGGKNIGSKQGKDTSLAA